MDERSASVDLDGRALDPADSRFAFIPTPALILDAIALDANIARMAKQLAGGRVVLRPHAKSHKCAEIARRQLDAGAVGICCATSVEAEDLAANGIGGLLITSPIAGDEKCRRFVELNVKSEVAAVVDDGCVVETLAAMATARPLPLLIDVDVGQGRTGLVHIDEIVALAKRIASHASLTFHGIQCYAGHVQHVVPSDERQRVARDVRLHIAKVIDALTEAGLPPRIVTGGGTGTSVLDIDDGVFTELQAGSYCLMDAEYRTINLNGRHKLPFEQSLYILATVVSRRPGQITLDSGTKSLATNGPAPDRIIGVPADFRFQFGGDEHGIVFADDDRALPGVGARVLVAPTHCDPTVNLHAAYHVVVPDRPVAVWPIIGRYRGASDAS